MSKLAVVLFTYNRLEYAKRTLESLFKNLHFYGEIQVHIADDGSIEGYREELVNFVSSGCGYNILCASKITCTNSERQGYGQSYNLATQVVHVDNDYILCLEDDWECIRELNLNLFLEAFQDPRIGCVRMGYIGYTQELKSSFISVANKHWLLLDKDSAEPHVFAGHPRLETVAWQRAVGEWPVGLDPNQTEFAVCHIKKAREGVVWPADLITPTGNLFAHFGAERAR